MRSRRMSSDAAQRLSELKKKLLLSRNGEPAVQPLPNPAPRPLTRVSAQLEPIRDAVAEEKKDAASAAAAAVVSTKKAPLTLRSLMSTRNKLKQQLPASGSRLKEAPAHRALLAESKSSLIRSKMISLSKQPAGVDIVPETVAAAINPFAVLFPASSSEEQFILEKRAWLERAVGELGIEIHEKPNQGKAMRVDQFIALHEQFLTLSSY